MQSLDPLVFYFQNRIFAQNIRFMTTFEQFNLPKSVQKAIDDLGFTTPTLFRKKLFCDNVWS
jgi:ATP-dependent RNA helicase RhlE